MMTAQRLWTKETGQKAPLTSKLLKWPGTTLRGNCVQGFSKFLPAMFCNKVAKFVERNCEKSNIVGWPSTMIVRTLILPVMMRWCFQTAWNLQITSWHFFRIPHKPNVLGRRTTSILRSTIMKLEIVPCHKVSHITQIDRCHLSKGRTWDCQGIV